ncbi:MULTISPECIES: hypothetical protein [Bacillaceae]|uniref:hypothetical protein n=1 Tax=Bacillaceae TaxID=186817 RepID=UPI000BFB5C58|nr:MULTISPECIES: hypothetical protein [Bacillaceae]PGT87838.1 hypothetical protein COD11_06520 [Bacillus sp. AFS040349]UGB32348.1 hypothetical protein LPC09_07940 [Metabacillus sp. B2-18]
MFMNEYTQKQLFELQSALLEKQSIVRASQFEENENARAAFGYNCLSNTKRYVNFKNWLLRKAIDEN